MKLNFYQKRMIERYLDGDNCFGQWGRRTGKTTVIQAVAEHLGRECVIITPTAHMMSKAYWGRRFSDCLKILPHPFSAPDFREYPEHVLIDEKFRVYPDWIMEALEGKHLLVLATPVHHQPGEDFYFKSRMQYHKWQGSPLSIQDEFRGQFPRKDFIKEFQALTDKDFGR